LKSNVPIKKQRLSRQHGFEVAEAGQAVDTWDMAWYKQVIRKMREII